MNRSEQTTVGTLFQLFAVGPKAGEAEGGAELRPVAVPLGARAGQGPRRRHGARVAGLPQGRGGIGPGDGQARPLRLVATRCDGQRQLRLRSPRCHNWTSSSGFSQLYAPSSLCAAVASRVADAMFANVAPRRNWLTADTRARNCSKSIASSSP